MKQRALLGRLWSPAGFGLVLIFFLLPFATVSCGTSDTSISVTFTGVDLALAGPPEVTITTAVVSPGSGNDSTDTAAGAELAALIGNETDLEPLALLPPSSSWPAWARA